MVDTQSSAEKGTHALHRSWTLWYDSPSTYNAENWELSLIPIMTVRTVEEFFVMLKYMKPLHALRTSSQYHFFQEGVKPMWEDEANKDGGKVWANLEIAKGHPNRNSDTVGDEKMELDVVWENILMALVGESLENENDSESHVMGVVMAKRKYVNRLAVWVKDANSTEAVGLVKKKLLKEIGSLSPTGVAFTKHGDKV